jgi:hypothetical protein
MNPSIKSEYLIHNTLIRAVQTHSLDYSYAVTIKWSCNRDGIVILSCNCSSKYCLYYEVTNKIKQCNISTHLHRCPFIVHGKRKNNI